MALPHVQRYSNSHIVRVQIKMTLRTPTRMAVIKKRNNVGDNIETLEPSYTAGGNVKYWHHFRKIAWQFFERLSIGLSYDPAIPLQGITQEKWTHTTT